MFGVPFLLLAACYAALPVEVPVLLNPIAGAIIRAPKSVFTVFRVPLMNLTHGLMAIVMPSRTGDLADVNRAFWRHERLDRSGHEAPRFAILIPWCGSLRERRES